MEAEKTMVSFRTASEANDSNQVNAKRNFSATIEDERNQLEEIKIMSGKENICEQSKSPSMLHVQSKLHQDKSDMNQHPSTQPLQPTKTRGPVHQESYGEQIVGALRQVINTPMIEYLQFNGDPLTYVTFLHNFKTCLERDNPDPERKLQLLIQHCVGKATESIESCVNLD